MKRLAETAPDGGEMRSTEVSPCQAACAKAVVNLGHEKLELDIKVKVVDPEAAELDEDSDGGGPGDEIGAAFEDAVPDEDGEDEELDASDEAGSSSGGESLPFMSDDDF